MHDNRHTCAYWYLGVQVKSESQSQRVKSCLGLLVVLVSKTMSGDKVDTQLSTSA